MLIKQYVRTIYFLGLKSCKWCIDGGGKGGKTPPPPDPWRNLIPSHFFHFSLLQANNRSRYMYIKIWTGHKTQAVKGSENNFRYHLSKK